MQIEIFEEFADPSWILQLNDGQFYEISKSLCNSRFVAACS